MTADEAKFIKAPGKIWDSLYLDDDNRDDTINAMLVSIGLGTEFQPNIAHPNNLWRRQYWAEAAKELISDVAAQKYWFSAPDEDMLAAVERIANIEESNNPAGRSIQIRNTEDAIRTAFRYHHAAFGLTSAENTNEIKYLYLGTMGRLRTLSNQAARLPSAPSAQADLKL